MHAYKSLREAFAQKKLEEIAAEIAVKTEASEKYSRQCQAKLHIFPDFEDGGTALGLCYASSQPAAVSTALSRPIEEDYYIFAGSMELWVKSAETEEVLVGNPGTKLHLPAGAEVQFRVTGKESCHYAVVTTPPYSTMDEGEVVVVRGKWVATEE